MDKLVIRGGNPLLGTIRVSGAKNAALPAMAAALLTDEPVILENIPQVRDIVTERNFLRHGRRGRTRLWTRTAPHHHQLRHCEFARSLLRTRKDHARVHAGAWSAGGEVRPCSRFDAGRLRHWRAPHRSAHQGTGTPGRHHHPGSRIRGSRADRLKGGHIVFDKITVTGTEDLLMAATLADGETLMENCAREPEVKDLADLLIKMGAKIEGAALPPSR